MLHNNYKKLVQTPFTFYIKGEKRIQCCSFWNINLIIRVYVTSQQPTKLTHNFEIDNIINISSSLNLMYNCQTLRLTNILRNSSKQVTGSYFIHAVQIKRGCVMFITCIFIELMSYGYQYNYNI